LFTSVVAFGVAALVAGLGVLFVLVGLALLGIVKRLDNPRAGVVEGTASDAPPAAVA